MSRLRLVGKTRARLNAWQRHQPVAHSMYTPSHDYGNYVTPQTIPMTERFWVILELQRHDRICTSVDRVWIIDSLEPHQQNDRQLAATRDELVMTLSDVNWTSTTLDVVRPDDPSLQFVIVKNAYSLLCNGKASVTSYGGIYLRRWKSILHFQRRWQNEGLVNAWWTLCWYMHLGKRLTGWTKHHCVE